MTDPDRDTVDSAAGMRDGDSIAEERTAAQEALRLMVAEAHRASEAGDHQRFDELLDRMLQASGAEAPERALERHGLVSKDGWRILVAMVLIAGLIASVIYAVARGNSGADGQTIAQYLSLVSGLAGIAIGWLYGDRTSA